MEKKKKETLKHSTSKLKIVVDGKSTCSIFLLLIHLYTNNHFQEEKISPTEFFLLSVFDKAI